MEGEHTIIGKIPRERLNQIASRKLSALGVPVRLGADRETLEGDLAFTRLVHPATGQVIQRARFVVVGHDHLRFLDPPLAALGAVGFYDQERLAALEQHVAAALQQRSAALQEVAARFRALRIEAALDPDRLAIRAVVKTPTQAFEILGAPDGARVSRVAPVGGVPFEISTDFPPLDLASFASATDLELFLSGAAPRMQPAPPSAAVASTDEAVLAPNAMVELIQEFQHGGTRYRFVAAREMGTRFKGRLIGPSGDVWSDRFELAEFPGTRKVVALALGVSDAEGSRDAAGAAAAAPAGGFPGHLTPQPDEVWVMNVVVEEAG